MKFSLRTKLIISFVVVILICGLVSTWVGVLLIGDRIISQAQDKVRLDLNSARMIYQNNLVRVKEAVRLTAVRFFLKENLSTGNFNQIKSEMERIRVQESLDILTVTNEDGTVIFRTRNPEVYGDRQADDELIKRVLLNKKVTAGTVIICREELVKEGTELVEQAHIGIIQSVKSELKPQIEDTSGLMLKAAAPVLDRDGRLLGILYGGILLNKNYEIVDKIRETVFLGEIYKGKMIGSSTIFKNDVRISTNVLLDDSSRAIGTQISKEVYDQVLIKGEPWIERTLVVNNWSFTAYEPIRNLSDNIIGILSVGMLEEKFTDMRRETILVFLGIALAGIVVALIISYFLANGILKPINRLVFASRQLAQGDWEQKVRIKSHDEIGQLGVTFNFMADSIKAREDELKQRTQQTIMESERLATIGQLAAGVAHEMNNPLGGILLYSNLLLEKTKEDDLARADLQRIVTETERCQKIVQGLLDFSRQTELEMVAVDVNKIVKNTLELVTNQKIFHNIQLIIELDSNLPKVKVDVGQMQQVFVNIILNAAEAMNGRGSLIVSSNIVNNEFVEVKFEDTGPGISLDIQKKIFDPFFTTKPRGKGTGLGLSIAYGIVRNHNGSIEVQSKEGKGSTFIIKIPAIKRGDS